jgi:glyoxylase-like metal-dependent hydrolase (beta-lactamase superfamily II)
VRLGHLDVQPLVDGYFTAPDGFFGDAELSTHPEILDPDGRLRLPIGCFLVRSGDRLVLIDAGVGQLHDEMFDGGQLLDALAGVGVETGDLDLVICSHLHLDHCGWLIDRHSQPVFPSATVSVGAGDWRYFVVDEAGFMRRSIRAGLVSLAEAGRVELLEGDAEIAPGVTVTAAPGHTPGHVCVVLSSGIERVLLLGDAIHCPVQLEETDWRVIADVDADLAARTRERLWRELQGEGVRGAGAHFPELRFGRVLAGRGRRWWTLD